MNNISLTTIVVEDEKLILKSIVKMIREVDSQFDIVATARNGQEGLGLIDQYTPKILMTDIKMPVMNGLELISRVNNLYPSIITVILSGYDEFDYAQRALKNGVFDYLLKPLDYNELKKTLAKIKQTVIAEYHDITEMTNAPDYTAEQIVDQVKQFFHENYRDEIDMSLLSNQLGFSSSYLTKIFTKHTTLSPNRYLNNYRIVIAKQIMSTQNIPIKILADQCGFKDQFYFSKMFKKITGISPTEYKASVQKENQ